MTSTQEKCIDVCNSLLRGELTAVETYEQALEKVKEFPERAKLIDILEGHRRSVTALRQNVVQMGGTPAEDSGTWGAFAKTVEGAAKLIGDETAIRALKMGEEQGKKDYEGALDNDDVMPACKTLIKTELMPKQTSHITTLERIVDAL